jgi:hypothetical protein
MTELKSEKRIRAGMELRLKKLGNLGPVLQGTAVKKYRKCTAKDCPCHSGRKVHPFTVVTTKEEGKTKPLYVPVEMEAEVEAWLKNFREAKRLLAEISTLSRELVGTHASRTRAASQRRRLLESQTPQTPSASSTD